MKNTKLFGVLLTMAMLLLPGIGAGIVSIDRILVIVNSEAITLGEYQSRHHYETIQNDGGLAAFNGEINTDLLEQMIDERIQLQQAGLLGISISETQLDDVAAFVAGRNQMTREQLLRQLKQDGITAAQFRSTLRQQRLIQILIDLTINSRVVISEQEVDNYLQNHRELLVSDEAFRVSHLWISSGDKSAEQTAADKENLVRLRQALLAGGSFEQAVADFSDGNKAQGGLLGWRTQNQLADEFVAALRRTEVGSVSEIIESGNGLHLLKLHDEKGRETVQQHKVRHILVQGSANETQQETLEKTRRLRQQILQGEDFDRIARLNSQENSTRADGGLLGWIGPGDAAPAFERAVMALKTGDISEPVLTPTGYHLIEVLERRKVDIVEANARDRARQIIFRRKAAELYNDWYTSIRNQAYIEYVGVDV